MGTEMLENDRDRRGSEYGIGTKQCNRRQMPPLLQPVSPLLPASDMQTGIPTASAASAKLSNQLWMEGGGRWVERVCGVAVVLQRQGFQSCIHDLLANVSPEGKQRISTHLLTTSMSAGSPLLTASMAAPAWMQRVEGRAVVG